MGAAFVWKTYKEAAEKGLVNAPTGAIQVLVIDKFALWAFKCLVYDCEVSKPLIANILPNFPEFYTPYKTIRKVNLQSLCCRFVEVVFEEGIKVDLAYDFICFKRSKKLPTSSIDDYHYKEPELALYFFYDYQKTITVIISPLILEKDIIFAYGHPNQKEKV